MCPSSRPLHLLSVALFDHPSAWDSLIKENRGRMLSYAGGSLLYSPDTKADSFFILLKGKVWLYGLSSQGRRILLARFGAGACFGEASLLGLETHEAFAQAVEDSTVYVVGTYEIEDFVRRHPEAGLVLVRSLGRRLRMAESRLEALAFRSVPERLARILLLLPRGEEGDIVGFGQGDLADIVGTHRETANKILRDLAGAGCIRLTRKKMTILDEDCLRHKAGAD